MDAQIKAKWLEALRSGKYEQGKNFLNKEGKYCCLGVLCDLIDPSDWRHRYGDDEVYHGRNVDYPEHGIMDKAGIGFDEGNYLATINDEGQSFAEIADYIETNY